MGRYPYPEPLPDPPWLRPALWALGVFILLAIAWSGWERVQEWIKLLG